MKEVESLEAFDHWSSLETPYPAVLQAIDLSERTSVLCKLRAAGSLFLGCKLDPLAAGRLVSLGAVVVPDLPNAFPAHRSSLYTAEDLYDVYDPDAPGSFEASLDSRVYQEYIQAGRNHPHSLQVSFARALHDHSITAALDAALEGQRVVAIMGGHGLERRDPIYAQVVRIAKALAERGYLLVSGGGPGAMEATHLGAWLSGRPDEVIDEVLGSNFSQRPKGALPNTEYADPCWLERAWRLRQKYPLLNGVKSIGIPTWLYGHEPPTPLATHIAKYFANAIREEGLLAIATSGVIFAPGSAGTTQEIFQDACQNHYGTAGSRSPMILLGTHYWTERRPVWPLLDAVSKEHRYGELVHIEDDTHAVIRHIQNYEPSWYLVSDDVDLALETELRHDLRMRSNFVFEHVRVERTQDVNKDIFAICAQLGLVGEVGEARPASAFTDWLFAIASDNWVNEQSAREAASLLGEATVHVVGEGIVVVREDSVSAWTLRLDD